MYQRHLFHDVRVDAWTIRRGGQKPRMIISTEDGETEERKSFVWFECVVGNIRRWDSQSQDVSVFEFKVKDHIFDDFWNYCWKSAHGTG